MTRRWDISVPLPTPGYLCSGAGICTMTRQGAWWATYERCPQQSFAQGVGMGFVVAHHQQVNTLFLGHAHNRLARFASAEELSGKRPGKLLGHAFGLGQNFLAGMVDGFIRRIEGSEERHLHHVQSPDIRIHAMG